MRVHPIESFNKGFTMFGRIVIWFLSVCIMLLISLGWYYKSKSEHLEIDNDNKDQAIKAYEDILVVVPFSAMTKERGNNAKKEINNTLNSGAISDGNYNGV